MFLPGVWVASRFGLKGAAAVNLAMQAGIALGIIWVAPSVEALTAYQFRMLSLTLTVLFLGVAVTQRRKAEDTLRAQQEQLAGASRLSLAGEMAAAMAHELNQPLSASMNYARAALRHFSQPTPDSAKIKSALGGAVTQAERAAAIIRTLREFVGRGQLQLVTLRPQALIVDVAALLRPDCDEARARLSFRLEKNLPLIKGDFVQIQQVLVNLIRNALQAMVEADSPRREVTVALRWFQGMVEIDVADTGPGIDDDLAKRLYQPFTSSKPTGMGLGLSISRTIIEAHGGRLWLVAHGAEGCVFRFTLPAVVDSGAEGS